MPTTNQTTLVSLFHTQEHASQALQELQSAGIPKQSIEAIGGTSANPATEQSLAGLRTLNLPAGDIGILSDGLKNGGTVIVVRAEPGMAAKAQSIFENQNAGKIDERGIESGRSSTAANLTDEAAIPVIEEQLVIGKRNVERGGVRVFTRVVETPVEEQVTLREEHATFERRPVNRPISEADVDALQDRSIEIRETAEEAVVSKSAHVVEEVHIGKDTTERTQTVKDTVRKTEVEVDQIDEVETRATRPVSGGAKKL